MYSYHQPQPRHDTNAASYDQHGDYSPEPWTPEWYAYCEDKYRSFDSNTGYYLAYSGNYRFCR